MTATSITECNRFAQSITAAGGVVPDPLRHLLSAWEVLSSPAATAAPENSIMDHALAGTLDAKMLAKLLPAAATAQMVDEYRGQFARGREHTLVGAFRRAVDDGGADLILNSLRDRFDEAAGQIAHARSLFTSESSAEHTLASGEAGTIEAWQALPGQLRIVAAIGSVAAQFGPSPLAWFPQLREYPEGDTFRISDTAIMCGDGGLVIDSAPFLTPHGDHKNSPWFQIPLRLHSVDSARQRYAAWCAAEFDRVHRDRPRGGRVLEGGEVLLDKIPPNPFRDKQEVDA